MGDFKLGICIWGFPVQGPKGLQIAAGMGFKGAAIDLGKYEDGYPLSDPQVQKEYLKTSLMSGIEIASLSVEVLNQYGLSNPPDSKKGKIAQEACYRGLDAAAELGVKVLQLPSFNDGEIKDEDGFWYTCEQIGLLCEKAKKYGIVVATENVLSIQDSLRMIEAVGSKQLKLIFDTQNYSMMKGYSAAEHLRTLHPYVEQIHIKDGSGGMLSSALLGSGDSGFMETAAVIKEVECGEWLLLENYYDRGPLSQMHPGSLAVVEADIKIARKIFDL